LNIKESIGTLSGVPRDIFKERHCRIFVPARNAMQSGTYNTKKWKIEWDIKERQENPLMGWVSSLVLLLIKKNSFCIKYDDLCCTDPHSLLMVEFGSKKDAMIYCERMGL
jgi:NADH dehydrogenase (ubiquinone) Fe-S protein 4